jgi:hypothetical protein
VIVVRELRYRVSQRGFRTHSVTLVTTLIDAEAYPLEALAELYGTRWRVEMLHPDYPSSDSLYRASRAA